MELASCKFRKKEIQNDHSSKKFCWYGILFFHLVQILISFSVYPRLLFSSRNCSHYYPVAAEILSENVFIRELFSLSPNHPWTVYYLSYCLHRLLTATRPSNITFHHFPINLERKTWSLADRAKERMVSLWQILWCIKQPIKIRTLLTLSLSSSSSSASTCNRFQVSPMTWIEKWTDVKIDGLCKHRSTTCCRQISRQKYVTASRSRFGARTISVFSGTVDGTGVSFNKSVLPEDTFICKKS